MHVLSHMNTGTFVARIRSCAIIMGTQSSLRRCWSWTSLRTPRPLASLEIWRCQLMLVASARPRARLTAPEVASASSCPSSSSIEWLCAAAAAARDVARSFATFFGFCSKVLATDWGISIIKPPILAKHCRIKCLTKCCPDPGDAPCTLELSLPIVLCSWCGCSQLCGCTNAKKDSL